MSSSAALRPPKATDVVSPAFETAKNQAFKPFRWSLWWRMGILGMATAEATGGGCNFNVPSGGGGGNSSPIGSMPAWLTPELIASIVTVIVLGALLIALVHLYIASVLRFVLFDSVATGRYRLREGWSRWHDAGLRYFWFNLVFTIVGLATFAMIALPFVLPLFRHGGKPALSQFLSLIFIMLPIILLVALVFAIVHVIVKDFGVPMIALEGLSGFAAMRRAFHMVGEAKGDFAGYIGMKIVLRLASSIIFGIINLIFFLIGALILIVPLIVLVVATGVFSAGSAPNPVLIAFLITLLVVAIFFLVYVGCVIATPATIFFQAYGLIFFAPRYQPLWGLLYPAPPAPPVAPPAPAPAT